MKEVISRYYSLMYKYFYAGVYDHRVSTSLEATRRKIAEAVQKEIKETYGVSLSELASEFGEC